MLWVLVDKPRFPDRAWMFLGDVARHVDGVLVRDQAGSPRDLLALGEHVRSLIGRIPLWVDGDLAVALALDAEGLHLPARHLPARQLRRYWPKLLSAAVHNLTEFADHRDADVLVWGHVFETRSKPGVAPRPRDGLAGILAAATGPVLAIGGITGETIGRLNGLCFDGVVVSDGIWSGANPVEAAENLARTVKEMTKRRRL